MENILEYLIPLIFIISIFSMRKKKKKRPPQEDLPPQQAQQVQQVQQAQQTQPEQPKAGGGGLMQRLNKLMTDYYEADLKGAPEKKTEPSGAPDPFDLQPPQREPEPWEDEDDYDEEEREPLTASAKPQEIVRETAVEEAVPRRPMPARAKAAPLEPEPVNKQPEELLELETDSYNLAHMNKADLRKAIVWSEILGPPKALRNE